MVIMKCIVCLLGEEGHGFRPPLPTSNYSVLLSQSYLAYKRRVCRAVIVFQFVADEFDFTV
jgi:hypothetical protein